MKKLLLASVLSVFSAVVLLSGCTTAEIAGLRAEPTNIVTSAVSTNSPTSSFGDSTIGGGVATNFTAPDAGSNGPSNSAPSIATGGGDVLRSAAWDHFPRVKFDAPDIEKWPRIGAKNVCAQLFLNGRKVEWIAAGRQFSSVHNATVPGGKYFQPMKSGDRVTISIADLAGRNESNSKELIVP